MNKDNLTYIKSQITENERRMLDNSINQQVGQQCLSYIRLLYYMKYSRNPSSEHSASKQGVSGRKSKIVRNKIEDPLLFLHLDQ